MFPRAIQLVFVSMHFNLSFLYNILINYVFNSVWLSLFDRVFKHYWELPTAPSFTTNCEMQASESKKLLEYSRIFAQFEINSGSLKNIHFGKTNVWDEKKASGKTIFTTYRIPGLLLAFKSEIRVSRTQMAGTNADTGTALAGYNIFFFSSCSKHFE